MQIAWLIAVIVGLAAGGLLVRLRAIDRRGQRGLRSPAGSSRRFAPQSRRLADLVFPQGRGITGFGLVLGMALLIGVGLVTIVWLPALLVPTGGNFADNDRLRAVNDVRGTLLQAVVALGAVIVAARTWQAVTERGQNMERLTRTVQQLTHPHVRLRLAAMFTLEQLARDSRRDRAAIAEILCGYVRTCSPWPRLVLGMGVRPGNEDNDAEPVDDVEQLQDPPVGGLVELVVQRPHMIGVLCGQPVRWRG